MQVIKLLLFFSILVLSPFMALAQSEPASVVVIAFADETPYREMNTAALLEERFLDELVGIPDMYVQEKQVVQEVLDIEAQLNKNIGDVENLVETKNFDLAFEAASNNISQKGVGEYVSSNKTQMLGKKHNARYLVHGTINYLGKNSANFMVPLKNFTLDTKQPYLEAVATIRIIEADTGKILWSVRERGVAKDTLVKFKEITHGTIGFSNTLFIEALDKICRKTADKLWQDLKNKKLIL